MRRRNLRDLKELVKKICPGLDVNINAFLGQEFTDMLDSMKPSLNAALNKTRQK